jgi:chemotaxis protein methyltransferase CheR
MQEIHDPDLRHLIRKVHDRTGIDLGQYKDNYIARRLSTRMNALGASDYRSYASRLDSSPGEYERVVDAFTINVSEFFRDGEPFRVLREKVIPGIVAEKGRTGRRSLRVWSAGCACGEEVYSVSMILHEVLGSEYGQFAVRLYATDIDDACMGRARLGVYDPASMKSVDKKLVGKYAVAGADGKLMVTEEVKRNVAFRRFDLINGGRFGAYFDLILCRNVMIYFSDEHKRKLLMSFYDALSPGGYLVIGKTETLVGDARTAFEPVNSVERIYRKPARCI